MNVGSLIEWAADMLLLLDSPGELPPVQASQLSRYLSWLSEYKEDVLKWNCISEMGKKARDLIRTEHLHIGIADRFVCSIADLPMGIAELGYSDQIRDFLLEQTQGLKPGEVYIGSSEIIESFFGKLKSMECKQTSFGFTSLVLAAIAHVGPLKSETVKRSISEVTLLDIDDWSSREIGVSVQSQRKTIRRCIDTIKGDSGSKHSGVLQRESVDF